MCGMNRKCEYMCTAITYQTKDHYFGRNLDLEYSYQETVTITPRNYPFLFRKAGALDNHYAMIGMAYVQNDYPLYYDAVNEKGLAMAGLNFPGNADYKAEVSGKDNITPFEFIPWILGQCATIGQAKALLKNMNLIDICYSEGLPLSPLHWMISDQESSITVESVKDGLKIYDNPIGVLTNNPEFGYHMKNLSNYLHLSPKQPIAEFGGQLPVELYSRGMGAMGLPGDWSSASRFVRAAYVKCNADAGNTESESVNQFFHLLSAVAHPRGCVEVEDDTYQITVYSCCCNVDKGIYYYTTYENRQITGVDMYLEDLEGCRLISYPLVSGPQIVIQNQK